MSPAKSPINSVIANMRDMAPEQRLAALVEQAQLDDADALALGGADLLPLTTANGMIENVVGKFELPLGVATNFRVNGKDYLVPMAVEEPTGVSSKICTSMSWQPPPRDTKTLSRELALAISSSR